MKYLLSLLFVFLSFNINSQNDSDIGAGLQNLTGNSALTAGTWLRNVVTTKTEGTVYLFEDWKTQGVITNVDGKNLSIKGLNYDAKNDAILAKISKDSVYMFNNAVIKEVIINKRKFKRYQNIDNDASYMEVLAMNNNIEILKRNGKKIKKGIKDPLTQVTAPDRYLDDNKIYFKQGNVVQEIKLKNKSFAKLFGEHSKEISNYMSKMKISVKDETKLQMILNYYGTL